MSSQRYRSKRVLGSVRAPHHAGDRVSVAIHELESGRRMIDVRVSDEHGRYTSIQLGPGSLVKLLRLLDSALDELEDGEMLVADGTAPT